MLLRAWIGLDQMWGRARAWMNRDEGATAVEYALMVALIAIVIMAAVAYLGRSASTQFSHMGTCLNTPSGTC
jgi:pilus assembly protein Flp/PilA